MKKNVLIVDDDQNITNSLSAILSSEGYNTAVADDKTTAFKKIKDHKPDVILLDVHISSDQEGYEITQEIYSDKVLKEIPIIILTSTEIVSGNNKIIDLARKFRNNPQFDYINAILNEDENGNKFVEYKSESTGDIINLPVNDVISKPVDTNILLNSLEKALL